MKLRYLFLLLFICVFSVMSFAQGIYDMAPYSYSRSDFNGDGKTDIGGFDGVKEFKFAISNGHGFDLLPNWNRDWAPGWTGKIVFTGDFDGDGKTDVGGFDGAKTWKFAISNGTGFDMRPAWNTDWDLGWERKMVFTGDFNGDGKTDIGGFDGDKSWRFAISNGHGFDILPRWNTTWGAYGWQRMYVFIGDFNGDGKTDIGGFDGDKIWRFNISNGNGFDASAEWNTTWALGWERKYVFTGDFNGDGKTDIGGFDGDKTWRFAISNGHGFDLLPAWNTEWPLGWTQKYIITGDFDGDGKTDIGGYDGDKQWNYAISNGHGFDMRPVWNKDWKLSWSDRWVFLNNYAYFIF